MVIPTFCPGVNIEIIVNGQPLVEYEDDDEGPPAPNTVTKYIEAQSEAHFAVRVAVGKAFHFPAGDLQVQITLDGKIVRGRIWNTENLSSLSGKIIDSRSCSLSSMANTVQKFRFIPLDLGKTPPD
jgi:hypothetical protein